MGCVAVNGGRRGNLESLSGVAVGRKWQGRWWDVMSSGQWHVGCGSSDAWRVVVVAGWNTTGRGASDGAGWNVKGGGGGTRRGRRPVNVGQDTWVGGTWAREKVG